uniref:Uncharacterized protein n=1 Tax=Rhizochromulina marina TaxID=1034831 RepID=A0A7S2WHU7_9STRA
MPPVGQLLVVGNPLNQDGEENFQSDLTRNFTQVLASEVARRSLKLGVYMKDERYSSAEAEANLQFVSKKSKGRMLAVLDAESACSILRAFFNEPVDSSVERITPLMEAEALAEMKRWIAIAEEPWHGLHQSRSHGESENLPNDSSRIEESLSTASGRETDTFDIGDLDAAVDAAASDLLGGDK